ncbi:hypothetical protein [Anaerotignum sp.]
MARMSITFKGFEQLAENIDAIGGDLHKAVDEALNESQKIIQSNLTSAAAPYAGKGRKGYATGEMYGNIISNPQIEWNGLVGEVKVGFNLSSGGWHSIFVMYGTPRMAKDPKVYNAIKGTKTKNQIAKKQEEIMQNYLKLE